MAKAKAITKPITGHCDGWVRGMDRRKLWQTRGTETKERIIRTVQGVVRVSQFDKLKWLTCSQAEISWRWRRGEVWASTESFTGAQGGRQV